MDKETLSNYGWIVICVLVLAVMIALATPFGTFVADAIKSTTQGLFDVNQNALNSTGLINIDRQEFESCDHDYEVTTTANCTTAGTTTHTCKLCGKSYSEETPASHTFDNANDMNCNVCNTTFTTYAFRPSDYDAKMGTTTATDAHVVVPETFEYDGKWYKTKTIYSTQYPTEGAFYNCTNLVSVTIPNSVTEIGNYAFYQCKNLTNINIPENITRLGSSAFDGCSSLTSINIPNSVREIGFSTFSGCHSLENVVLPEGLYSLGHSVFYNCKSLKNIVISSNSVKVWSQTFVGCTSLTSVDFSNCNNLQELRMTFEDCSALESVIIPSTVTTLSAYAFENCEKLTNITFKGTMEQWNAITKGTGWNRNTGAYTVHCSDGDIAK